MAVLSGSFNKSNRGYPDVVAWSSFVSVYVDGGIEPVAGTSVSAPVMGAMISLANSRRLEQGGPTMGFINPFIYEYSHMFVNDIVVGNNTCLEAGSNNFFENTCDCCKYGYYASEGWDPVSSIAISYLLLMSVNHYYHN
jgi:tripeptidyl-peptidase-1